MSGECKRILISSYSFFIAPNAGPYFCFGTSNPGPSSGTEEGKTFYRAFNGYCLFVML